MTPSWVPACACVIREEYLYWAWEVTAVSKQACSLSGGRHYLIPQLLATNSPEKWPSWREVRTLHCLYPPLEHAGMCRALGELPLSPAGNSNYILMCDSYTYFKNNILLGCKGSGIFFFFVRISKSLVFGLGCISRIRSQVWVSMPLGFCPVLLPPSQLLLMCCRTVIWGENPAAVFHMWRPS